MDTSDKISIFVVDDDEMYTRALTHQIKEANQDAEVRTFTSGRECLQNLDKDTDIVILDYALCGRLNGVQVLNKIKQLSPGTKVIMLSNSNDPSLKKDTLKYGAYDFISKGNEALYKLEGEIFDISSEIEQTKEIAKEDRRVSWINLSIILLLILAYIFTHLK